MSFIVICLCGIARFLGINHKFTQVALLAGEAMNKRNGEANVCVFSSLLAAERAHIIVLRSRLLIPKTWGEPNLNDSAQKRAVQC